MTGPYKRKEEVICDTEAQRRGSHMKTEAEAGGMQPRAQEHQALLANTRRWRRQRGTSPGAQGGSRALPTPQSQTSGLQK